LALLVKSPSDFYYYARPKVKSLNVTGPSYRVFICVSIMVTLSGTA